MNVIIRESAEDDLHRIFRRIATDNPRAATAMVARIREHINLLELDALAHMGRPGLIEGTRELIEYPYIIVYQVFDDRHEVVIVSIIHGKQDREEDSR